MLKKIKIIGLVTAVILFMIIVLFFEIKHLENEKLKYDEFKNVLYKIESLNKNLNFFVFGEKKVYNLDTINEDIVNIKLAFVSLRHSPLYQYYKNDVDFIIDLFEKKEMLIERYKSYNAINLSTIIYLIDLASKLNVTDKKEIDRDIFDLFKTYLGVNTSLYVSRTSETDGQTKLFYDFLYAVKKKLNEINKIRKEIKNLRFENKIDVFIKKFEKDEEDKFQTTEFILKIIQSVFVLLLFIYTYIFLKIISLQKKLFTFKLMVEKSDNSVLLISPSNKVVFANEMFYKKSGYKKTDILKKDADAVFKKMVPEKVYKKISENIKNRTSFKSITETYNKFSKKMYEKIVLLPIYQEKEFLGFTFLKSDLTEVVKKQKELEYLAYHDMLTGLYNREKLKADIKKCKRDFYLFYMDLDEFKSVNESFSHDFGDEVIINVASVLKKYSEYVYRIGGDEFVFIGFKHPKMLAKNVLRDLGQISFNKKVIELKASIGIVKNDYKDYETLITLGEYALNRAKKSKEKCVLFDKSMYEKVKRRIEIVKRFPQMVENGELYVRYQPKINTEKGTVYSLEALIGWYNEELKEIYPNEFIPLAEEKNFITDIDLYILGKVCEDFKDLKKSYEKLNTVSVNLSGVDLIDRNLVEKIKKTVEKYNMNPEFLEFEITETSLIKNIETSRKILQELKKEGFKIAIDDFGTGYSSLNYIIRLNPDIVKIDKTFVDEIERDVKKREMVKIIKYISEKLNLEVVVEGVENEKQIEILKSMGLYNIQGYYFSKPLRKNEVISFLKRFKG